MSDSRTRIHETIVSWPEPYPPTVREIAEAVNLGISAVHAQLRALRDDGVISWEPEKPRTIRVLATEDPEVGEIEAPGRGIHAPGHPRMSAEEFRDAGYLQELNRLFLHPLGLALGMRPTGGADGAFIAEIFDARDDPEGLVFAGFDEDGVTAAHQREDEIAHRWDKRSEERRRLLGFVIQDVEDFDREL